jgi:hypothetical protein
VGKIAYTVIQRATAPGDFAHAVRRCEIRVGKRAATYAFRSTPERARLPTLRRHIFEVRAGEIFRHSASSRACAPLSGATSAGSIGTGPVVEIAHTHVVPSARVFRARRPFALPGASTCGPSGRERNRQWRRTWAGPHQMIGTRCKHERRFERKTIRPCEPSRVVTSVVARNTATTQVVGVRWGPRRGCSLRASSCKTHVEKLARENQASVEAAWQALIAGEKHLTTARQLYRGRAFALALHAADKLHADLGIISAGLGYIRGHTRVPSYDLTVRPGSPSSVTNRVRGTFDPQSWWSSVASGPFSTPLVEDMEDRPLVALCLSRGYALLIARDLLTALRKPSSEIRIFGLSIIKCLPADLRPFVLPYDERLSQVGLAGTRVDFPQRALAHYVEFVAPETGVDLKREHDAVNRMLLRVRHLPPRVQKRVEDQVIKELIRNLIPQLGPSRTRILAHLRHSRGLSCEQRRFASLFNAVRAETAQ